MKKAEATKKATSKKRPVRSKRKCVVFWNNLSKKRRVLLVFACLIVLSAIMYFAYAWYQGYAFKKVEKKMDILTQEIVTKLGEPVSQSKEQSCGHTSAKFSKGELWCRSEAEIVYHEKAPNLESLVSDVRNIVSENNNFTLIRASNLIKDLLTEKDINPSDTIYKSGDTVCRISYTSDASGGHTTNQDVRLSIYPTCSNNPLRPIFPVKD
jgi:hypothetical protein